MTALRRSRLLVRALLRHLEARPTMRRAMVRQLDRFPSTKHALKRVLAETPIHAAGEAVRSRISVAGLSTRSARVLADLERARAARSQEHASNEYASHDDTLRDH